MEEYYYKNPNFGTENLNRDDIQKNYPYMQKAREIISSNSISTIDTLLKKNSGKMITIHATFINSGEEKEFIGILESANNDSIVISEPKSGIWSIIPLMYINYMTFNEPINYFDNNY